jgi:hypothetical protein
MMTALKLGQVVRCLVEIDGNSKVKDKIGFVRGIHAGIATIQFFEPVGGHTGFDHDGLEGHCWNISRKELDLLYEGTLIPDPVPKTVMPPPTSPPVYTPLFRIGDIVAFIPDQFPADHRGPIKYSVGMVRIIDMDAALHYGVEFFSSFRGGHNLGTDGMGRCPEGHGWWIAGEDLTLRHRISKLEQCLKCMDENRGFDEDEDDDA